MTVTVNLANGTGLTAGSATHTADEFDVDGDLLYVGAPDATVAVYAAGFWASAVVS